MKIIILAIGKLKSRPVREIVADYSARIGHYLPVEISVHRDEAEALEQISAGDFFIALDEDGKQMSSTGLAELFKKHQMRGTKRLLFLIGGQDGIGETACKRANLVLSLSAMTFPHELVQAILLEQIYRACSIIRGEPYHRP